jgi:hypothetical protein
MRCRDETFFGRDSVEWVAETSSLSCGNFNLDGLNESFFLVAGEFVIDRDPLEWAERSSLSCGRTFDFDFDRPDDSLDEEKSGPSTDETGLLPVSMNVLDVEEDGAFVILGRELVPPLMSSEDGPSTEEAGLPPAKAFDILSRELVPPLLGGEAGPSTEESGLPPDKAFDILSRELVPPLDFGT